MPARKDPTPGGGKKATPKATTKGGGTKKVAPKTGKPQTPTRKHPCGATTKRGTPCKVQAVVVDGVPTDRCMAHTDDQVVREKAGFGGRQPGSGRPKLPTATEIIQRKLEEHADELIAKVLGIAADGSRYVVTPTGISVKVEDQSLQLRAADSALDRLVGKPKSGLEVEHTGNTGPTVVAVPWNPERAAEVASILAEVGATQPTTPTTEPDDGEAA